MGDTETQKTDQSGTSPTDQNGTPPIDRQDPFAPSRSNMSAYLWQKNQYFDQAKVPAPLPFQPPPGPSSETNAAPAPAPGSFADKLGKVTGFDAANYGGFLITGLRAGMQPALASYVAGAHTMAASGAPSTEAQPKAQAAGDLSGNVSWDAAQQNDQTQPINPNQLPKEDTAHKVQRGLAGTLGDLFSMGGPNSEVEHAKRMEEENRTRALSALTNIQMVREQQMLHKGAQDQINEAAKTGAEQFALLSAAPEAKVVTEGKTSDQLQQMLRDKSLNTSTMQIFQTGRVQVGTDKTTGDPQFRSTYSVLIPGGPVTLGLTKEEETGDALKGAKMTPEQREAAKSQQGTLDYLNANIPGMHMQPGQVLPSMQLAALMQKANSNARAFEQRDHWLAQQAATKHEAELTAGDKEFMANTSMLKILNQYTDHNEDKFAIQKGYVALENAMAGSDDQAKALRQELGTDWREKFEHAYGGHEYFEKRMAEYDKQTKETADAQNTAINNPAKDPESVKPLLRIPMDTALKAMDQANVEKKKADAIIRDPNADPEEKAKAQETYNRADRFYQQNKASYDKMQGATNIADETMKAKATQAGAKSGAEAAAKKDAEKTAGTNGSTETGEAFVKTLPTGRADMIRGIDNGQVEITSNMFRSKDGQALLQDILQYDPDFDQSRAQAYVKARKDFTTGQQGIGINAANTVLHHLNRMHVNLDTATAGYTGGVEQFFGGNETGRQVAADAHAISNELGRLYTGGVVAENEKAEWEKKLNPNTFGMTINKLRTNVKEFTELLGGKLEAFQDQWDDATPSTKIRAPKRIASQESLGFYKKLTGKDLEVHDVQPGTWNPDFNGGSRAVPAAQAVPQQNASQVPNTGIVQHKVGDQFKQNGVIYTVKSLNPDGSIKEAD